MEVTVSQKVYYSNKEWVPVSEIAESLLALESLIKSSPDVLEKLFPGVVVDRVDVFISELKSDSIWEDLVIKFVFGSQENFDEQISKIRKKVGMEFLDKHPNVLGAIIGAMILGGAILVIDSITDSDEKKATIEANNNTIINIGAGEIDLDAGELQAIISGVIKKNPKIAEDALKVIKPARRDSSASITINDEEHLTINAETIKVIPTVKPPEEEVEIMEDFDNLVIEIRATDLDSTKQGWAAVPIELGKKRIRLQLDPTINTEALLGERQISGRATVVFKVKGKDKVPKLIFLRSVNES